MANKIESVILELSNMPDKSTLEDSERMLRSFFRTIEPHYKRNLFNPDRISWEIYAERDKIAFYIWIPKRIDRLVRSRLIDAYPQVEIKEIVDDHVDNFKKPLVAQMDLNKHYMFSTNLESNDVPLNSILNSMSRLQEKEKMLLQISLVPINDKWQGRAYKKYRDLLFNGSKPQKMGKSILTRGVVWSLKSVFMVFESILSTFIRLEAEVKNTPIERSELKATQKKISMPGFKANVRLAVESPNNNSATTRLSELSNSFIELDSDNEWRRVRIRGKHALNDIKDRRVDIITNNIVTTGELSPIIRLQNKNIIVPELNVKRLKTLPIPQGFDQGLYLGQGMFHSKEQEIYIPTNNIDDLVHPMICTGGVGGGKTTVIMNMALARALAGYGVILMDTQGDMSQDFLSQIPESEHHRVVWLNFGDILHPVALDLLEFISLGSGDEKEKDQNMKFVKSWAKNELIELFKKIYGQNFGPATEYLTRNNISAIIETDGTIVEMLRMMLDDEFRTEIMMQLRFKSPMAFSFWKNFQQNFSLPQKVRMVTPSINKIAPFIEDPVTCNILAQGDQRYSFRDMIDNGKIVVVTIPKGKLIGTWKLIGSLILSKIWLASVTRENINIKDRKPAFLYCDEAEDLINDNFPIMLSQSRKYRLGIVMGFQYLDQIKQENRKVYKAMIGNKPSIIATKVGDDDVNVYSELFQGFYDKQDFNMPSLHAIVTMPLNGQRCNPFTMRIPANYLTRDNTWRQINDDRLSIIQNNSRKLYARPVEEVEEIVVKKYDDIVHNLELVEEIEELSDEAETTEDLLEKLRASVI